MSIKSYAFGRVTLSGADAEKFVNQVVYGKPKAAAVRSVKHGVKLSRAFQQSGMIELTVKKPREAVIVSRRNKISTKAD